jgi:uncharacterized protein Yka (UPF0111/DUF47 family)
MDVTTGLTILGGIIVVVGGIVKALTVFKKPDETWREPFQNLDRTIIEHEKATTEAINALDNRMTKVETQLEGISEIKTDINKLDDKIDKLTNTIIEWIGKSK